jgi:hypothetical protein
MGVTPAALESAERYRERRLEILDGVGVDLPEQRETVALLVAVVEYPILRLALRVESPFIRHVSGMRRCQGGRHQ